MGKLKWWVVYALSWVFAGMVAGSAMVVVAVILGWPREASFWGAVFGVVLAGAILSPMFYGSEARHT